MKLQEYEGKRVRIIDVCGRIYIGLADIYSYADNNESGIASILFVSDDGAFIEIEETEIAKVELIGASVQSLAVAV